MALGPFKHAQAIFVGSVMFAILAVGFITLLGSTNRQSTEDVRAKAGATATLKLTGTVSSVDATKGILIVDGMQFLDQTGGSLGTWTVTPPQSFSLTSVSPGIRVTITVNPTTFIAASHTVTATQITVSQ